MSIAAVLGGNGNGVPGSNLNPRVAVSCAWPESLVCRECAVRFGPLCAKVCLFDTSVKMLPCGLELEVSY